MPIVRVRSEDIPIMTRAEADRINAIPDEEIDTSEIPELDEEWFAKAVYHPAPGKKPISLRVDADVLEWFRAQGKGYQSFMNAVLRAYMQGVEDQKRRTAQKG